MSSRVGASGMGQRVGERWLDAKPTSLVRWRHERRDQEHSERTEGGRVPGSVGKGFHVGVSRERPGPSQATSCGGAQSASENSPSRVTSGSAGGEDLRADQRVRDCLPKGRGNIVRNDNYFSATG